MKFFKYVFLFTAAAIVISTCSRTTEPTSPNSGSFSLKNENDSAVVVLNYNESATINDKITVKFVDVPADTRCPINAFCLLPGDGEAKLKLFGSNIEQDISLHTFFDPKECVFSGFRMVLKSLKPYPRTDTTFKPEDYSLEMVVRLTGGILSNSVQLIDNENNSGIKKDLIKVNAVSLEGNNLNLDMNYVGGCRTHSINLFAFKGIQKSNPAQVTLMLSHDADGDGCEAIIQKKASFDLTPLKEYLNNHFNIRDKVILLLFDPQGRPLRDPAVEYNLQ